VKQHMLGTCASMPPLPQMGRRRFTAKALGTGGIRMNTRLTVAAKNCSL
jgi:hypothetical protein